MKAKQRAKWWIVSTHVLTTGFAIPVVSGILGGSLCAVLGLQGIVAYLFMLAVQAGGYIGATYYSLRYLKKSAISAEWVACTVPAAVSFAVLAVLGLVGNAIRVSESIPAVLGLLVFYGVIIAAFTKITARGFRALQAQGQPTEALEQAC